MGGINLMPHEALSDWCYAHLMSKHDHSYKLLFSHAAIVEDLLRGFIHEESLPLS